DLHPGPAAGGHVVDRLDHEEEHGRGDGDERDDVVEKVAVGEDAPVDPEVQRAEVGLAEYGRHDRGQDVGHHRLDHGLEGEADHHGHGQIDHVAPEDELLELLPQVLAVGHGHTSMESHGPERVGDLSAAKLDLPA